MQAQNPSSDFQQQQQQQTEQPRTQLRNDAVEKALAIAMRFRQESNRVIDGPIDNSTNYGQQRREYFQEERRKLQAFRLKNLEYVMNYEEKALRQQVECMNQMAAYEERQQLHLELQQQHQRQRQLQLEQKQQQKEQMGISNDGQGGIGSGEQKRAERARKRQLLEHKASGVYLTNLPTDGSTTERTLRGLFCSYGRLDRITMYRHRSTGELKGDGLIVFGQDAVYEYKTKSGNVTDADLVEAVCRQVSLHLWVSQNANR